MSRELDASTLASGAQNSSRLPVARVEKRNRRASPCKYRPARVIDQAPTDGRLAAAISTISANRRRIRDEVARSSEFTRCISTAFRTAKACWLPSQIGDGGEACRGLRGNSNRGPAGRRNGRSFMVTPLPMAVDYSSAVRKTGLAGRTDNRLIIKVGLWQHPSRSL
jgi:hypothetical protein